MEQLLLFSLAAKKSGRGDGELPERSPDTSKDEEKSVDTPKFGDKPGEHSPPDNASAGGSQSKSGQSQTLQRRGSSTSI